MCVDWNVIHAIRIFSIHTHTHTLSFESTYNVKFLLSDFLSCHSFFCEKCYYFCEKRIKIIMFQPLFYFFISIMKKKNTINTKHPSKNIFLYKLVVRCDDDDERTKKGCARACDDNYLTLFPFFFHIYMWHYVTQLHLFHKMHLWHLSWHLRKFCEIS